MPPLFRSTISKMDKNKKNNHRLNKFNVDPHSQKYKYILYPFQVPLRQAFPSLLATHFLDSPLCTEKISNNIPKGQNLHEMLSITLFLLQVFSIYFNYCNLLLRHTTTMWHKWHDRFKKFGAKRVEFITSKYGGSKERKISSASALLFFRSDYPKDTCDFEERINMQ